MGNDTMVWTVREMAAALKISMPVAYRMTEEEGFPVLRVGRKKLIIVDELDGWLKARRAVSER